MIQLYWKNATADAVGPEHGLAPTDLANVEHRIIPAHATVMAQVQAGKLGYADLPLNAEYRAQVKAMAARYQPNTTDMVVLGIGGSALGNIALQAALNPHTYNLMSDRGRGGPRLFVLDNVDPALLHDTLRLLGRRLRTTLVNVISKSGETAETAAQFMIVRELLRKHLGDGFAQRIVATTDAAAGTLHEIASAEGYAMLPVPPDVGGRFSVLSPVGLFSAAMCGIDIDELLAGAAAMKLRTENAEMTANPASMLAAIKFLAVTAKGKPLHVMMPYSNRLTMLADWYRQLWAESLGKKVNRAGEEVFAGPTPIRALGATDQHSQIQLYREGPNDKLIVFLEVVKHPVDQRVPEAFTDVPGLAYLAKARLSKLLGAEKTATEYALAVSQRPSVTIRFDAITPFSVGEFIYMYEFTTSLMGELLNINAYDQPAVELGKQATFALMGREGYNDMAAQIKPFTRLDKKHLA
ncbi:MAG TPA: glucose-6-phosphate isomerase [Phycisphaerae bacterium]|nr:glucose-6-phosphate isomerase [Phycisphaerae bacterium]